MEIFFVMLMDKLITGLFLMSLSQVCKGLRQCHNSLSRDESKHHD